MPGPAMIAPASQQAPGGAPRAPGIIVPFTRAAIQYDANFGDQSRTLSAVQQDYNAFDIPAYGYLRGVTLQVDATGSARGAATVAYTADGPWSVLRDVSLTDTNGANILRVSGYQLYLVNLFGAYNGYAMDPALLPDYLADAGVLATAGDFSFRLYLPLEISERDAVGSLPNGNDSQRYKLNIALAPSADVYTTAPATTLPNVRVRCTLHAWSEPQPFDRAGNPQETQPPFYGTTQFWSRDVETVPAQFFEFDFARRGNVLRSVILVSRLANGVRSTTNFPDDITLTLDTVQWKRIRRADWREMVARQFAKGNAAAGTLGTLPVGVFPLSLTDDLQGIAGADLRDRLLPTTGASKLAISGTFAAAGTVEVITNDLTFPVPYPEVV